MNAQLKKGIEFSSKAFIIGAVIAISAFWSKYWIAQVDAQIKELRAKSIQNDREVIPKITRIQVDVEHLKVSNNRIESKLDKMLSDSYRR